MEFYDEGSCNFEDWSYPPGSMFCCEGDCMVCRDGEWRDLKEEESEKPVMTE